MKRLYILLIIFIFLFEHINAQEIEVSTEHFVFTAERYHNKCIVMEMRFREFASIQNKSGFTKCTMEGIVDSLLQNGEQILFYNVYLDSDTIEKWAKKLVFGKRIIVHAYVGEANRNWTQLNVYKIEEVSSP